MYIQEYAVIEYNMKSQRNCYLKEYIRTLAYLVPICDAQNL